METLFKKISKIIESIGKKHKLLVLDELPGSTAKVKKPQLILYGKKEVNIANRPLQKTYVGGVMLHKDYVGFYSMGVYAFPKAFSLSPALKKALKGKSCFHIKGLTPEIEKELKDITEKTIKIFKENGWI